MQELRPAHGATTISRAVRFLLGRLGAFRRAAPICAELKDCLTELTESTQAFETALVERMTATAEVSYRDKVLDRLVKTLETEARRCVPSVDDSRYRRMFPMTAAEGMASTGGHRQHEFVRQILRELASSDGILELRAHAAGLSSAQHALEVSIQKREAAHEPERQALIRRNHSLEATCYFYNRCPARLQLLFNDPLLIESLFPELPEP